ncbi:MAG: nucleotidyltransferase domain-containing protein [Planctomycetes bacterium]|nr:nucleotidyltransferase domain-containing protein [Planctomycetota bacterium]
MLFGSYARGNADENSDVDFLVIAESGLPRFKRSYRLYKLFEPYLFDMDILVYTPVKVAIFGVSLLRFCGCVNARKS